MARSSFKDTLLPTFGNRADAEKAMKGGAIAAWVVMAVNIAIGAYILFAAPEAAKTFGITGAAIVDGVIFGITGIAIWRFSVFGAWFGLGFFTLEKVYQWTTQPKALTGIVVAVALWLAFYNGVRGAMALRKMKLEAAAVPAAPEAS